MVAFDIASAIAAGLAFLLSLTLGIPAFVRAGRAERRAESAERRADRIESRDTERHDTDWRFQFREGDLTVLEITNAGADDAHGVIVIADIDGRRVYEEREVVRGRSLDIVEASFPFLTSELERVALEGRLLSAQTNGLGSVVLGVTVNVRVHWSTALGAPRSIDSGPRAYELT